MARDERPIYYARDGKFFAAWIGVRPPNVKRGSTNKFPTVAQPDYAGDHFGGRDTADIQNMVNIMLKLHGPWIAVESEWAKKGAGIVAAKRKAEGKEEQLTIGAVK
jgi:hypothetical protein